MKIISWNCHYGFTKDKQDRIREFARKHDDADIYLIQEARENDIINLTDFPHRHWYGDHAEFGACHKARANSGDLGIAIMSNKYEIKRVDAEGCFNLVLDIEKLLKKMLDSFDA